MNGYNRVVVLGNLTGDPELRKVPSGASVAEFGLALNERYRDRQGQTVEKTCFVDIVAWERQAELVTEYLHKGSPALVEGRLQLDRWEDSEGRKHSKLRVRADRVQFLPKTRAQAPAPAAGAPAAQEGFAPAKEGEVPF